MRTQKILRLFATMRVRKYRKYLIQVMCRRKLQIRTRNYVTKACLGIPQASAWMELYEFGDDGNFIALTSLSRQSFERLLERFRRFYPLPRLNRGRPRALQTHHQVLGLVLQFYTASIEYKNLCQIFCIPPATLCRILRKAEESLYQTLRHYPDARFKWPTLEQQELWGQLVAMKNSLVTGRWGFIDGKNYRCTCVSLTHNSLLFRVQKPTNVDLQNAQYNGWLHATLITGTLCFGVDGTIVWGRHNYYGSWNDGEMSRRFQEKLCREDINLPHHGVLSDSAFPVKGALMGRIMTPLKSGDLERAPREIRPQLVSISSAITSMRQSAEWGMGAVCKVYRLLNMPLQFDQRRRHLRLMTIHHLYNYRVRSTGISQIASYFNCN